VDSYEQRFSQGIWKTKEKAETFLQNWETKMTKRECQNKLEQARKDQAAIENNVKELEEQFHRNTPERVNVGEIYYLPNMGNTYMVTSDTMGRYILTVVGHGFYDGCYTGRIQTSPLYQSEMRDKLIEQDAEYLGQFGDLFMRRENEQKRD